MIEDSETTEFAERFGVPNEQVRRDHFISHILAALGEAETADHELVFFGGTLQNERELT